MKFLARSDEELILILGDLPGELFLHRYAVLGDDIVIADEAVAQSYSSALT